MKALQTLQTEFSQTVFDGIDSGIHSHVVERGLATAKRLQVYRNNIYSSLTDALKAIYPVIDLLVGEEYFKYCAHEYIARHPSLSGNLHEFGKVFPAFLQTLESAQDLPYLKGVAELEWAYHYVFHAAESEQMNIDKLQSISTDNYWRIHFILNTSCQLVQSEYPILKIWKANQNSQPEDETISLDDGGVQLVVFRNKLDIEFHHLSPAEYAFLDACRHNTKYIEACEIAVLLEPDFNIKDSLLKLINCGIIVNFTT